MTTARDTNGTSEINGIEERFVRTALLLGEEALSRLNKARVAVCGLGGVGAAACEALARSGVATLRLIDFDRIVLSNLNRQIPALTSTVGRQKAEVMAERVAQINPGCRVELRSVRLTEDNVVALLSGMDWVVDAIDDVTGKVAIIQYCLEAGIGIVSSMGTGNKLYPELLRLGDIAETKVCPLARMMRQRLRQVGIEKGVPVVYSTEPPIPPKEKLPEGQRAIGSIAFVPPVAGMFLAGYVVRQIAGMA